MNWLDFTIVIVYLIAFLGLGYFFKENKNAKDYFLGGQSKGWFPLSLSTMATQLSEIKTIHTTICSFCRIGSKWRYEMVNF